MPSLFEKILKSVNSGVSIEEALAKHGTNQEVVDELLAASGATSGQVWQSDGTNGSWADPQTGADTVGLDEINTVELNPVIQVQYTQDGAVATGTTTIPLDDTIPQNTEGTEFMTVSITPKNTSNLLRIDVDFYGSHAASNSDIIVALFQDSTANALAATSTTNPTSHRTTISFSYYMLAGTTSSTTFKIRAGGHLGGTLTFNGASGGRYYGGVAASSISVTEYQKA